MRFCWGLRGSGPFLHILNYPRNKDGSRARDHKAPGRARGSLFPMERGPGPGRDGPERIPSGAGPGISARAPPGRAGTGHKSALKFKDPGAFFRALDQGVYIGARIARGPWFFLKKGFFGILVPMETILFPIKKIWSFFGLKVFAEIPEALSFCTKYHYSWQKERFQPGKSKFHHLPETSRSSITQNGLPVDIEHILLYPITSH